MASSAWPLPFIPEVGYIRGCGEYGITKYPSDRKINMLRAQQYCYLYKCVKAATDVQ